MQGVEMIQITNEGERQFWIR